MSNEFGVPDWWWKRVQDEGRQLSRTEWHLARKYGIRGTADGPGNALFDAYEFGYQCPSGHRNICWSEFNEHIWCKACNLDYLTRKCPIQRPSWMDPEDFKRFVNGLPFKAKVLPGLCEIIG